MRDEVSDGIFALVREEAQHWAFSESKGMKLVSMLAPVSMARGTMSVVSITGTSSSCGARLGADQIHGVRC